MTKITEPFGAVPKRLADSVANREISGYGFTILCWLELKINYRIDLPVWRGSTEEMHAALDWPRSVDHLSREIKQLHLDGWIVSGARRGVKTYPIQLLRGGANRARIGRTSLCQPDLETLQPDSGVAAKPDADRPQAVPDLESVRFPQKQKAEGRSPTVEGLPLIGPVERPGILEDHPHTHRARRP